MTFSAKHTPHAVFLDRDGTINHDDPAYLHRPEDLVLIPKAADAIAALNRAGVLVFVATNQSGIARGYYTEDDFWRVMRAMEEQLASRGAHVDGIAFCPHLPEGVVAQYRTECTCRKPLPGQLERFMHEYDLDPSRCVVVGDKSCDIEAGKRAGMQTILVRTGHGREHEQIAGAEVVVDDLSQAVNLLLAG